MKILSIQTILDNVITKKINKNLFDHIIGNENILQEIGINLTQFYQTMDENGNLLTDPNTWSYATPVLSISQYQKHNQVLSLFEIPTKENDKVVCRENILGFDGFKR